MWSNLHTHTFYCDGKSTFDDYLSHNAAKGLLSIGFSSHAPLPFPCKWCMQKDDIHDYINAIEDLKKHETRIEVYSGLEVDFIPNKISPKDFARQLDYTIGSIHFVESLTENTPWEIDGAHTHFLEGLSSIFKNNIKEAVTRYFELTEEMVRKASPSIVGHLDKIKIQNQYTELFREDERWYREAVLKLLDAIEEAGVIVEVNTRGIYQNKTTSLYPSPWILQEIAYRNIPITLNSDAHHADDTVNFFGPAAQFLNKLGIQNLHVLHEGKWKSFKYNEHGLIL